MSLLTRCPACTTLYRVVPDQLRISEGWVKCGQCGDIFDASRHLIEAACDPESPNNVSVDAKPEGDVQVTQSAEDTSWLSGEPTHTVADTGESHSFEHNTTRESDPALEAASDVIADATPALPAYLEENEESQSLASDSALLASDDSAPDDAQPEESTRVRWDDRLTDQYPAQILAQEMANDQAQMSFMQSGDHPLFWRKPLVRGVLSLVSLVLVLALAAQWVYFGRDRLAAQYPDLKPTLQAFCRVSGCAVQGLQRVESLSVDSVVFHQLDKEAYRLTFTVKNSHALPLAFPSVELALTDAQDQPVYRRVFSSTELGVVDTEIAAGAERPVVLALRVSSMVPGQRVFGYRLLAFYP